MKKIAELFERPVDRTIEEVIKVDQANEQAVRNEIDEYTVWAFHEKCDWARQAMESRPDRVEDACRKNKSFAIAHGLEHLCPADPPKKNSGRRNSTA